jgi:hypothetical protein
MSNAYEPGTQMSQSFDQTSPMLNPNDSGAMPLLGLREGVHESDVQGKIQRTNLLDGVLSRTQGSDKYAVLLFQVDNKLAYQLLPVGPDRCVATIVVPANVGQLSIVVGPQPMVDSGLGFPVVQGGSPLVFTSKGALYAIASTATPVAVAVLVEKYNSGTPVN